MLSPNERIVFILLVVVCGILAFQGLLPYLMWLIMVWRKTYLTLWKNW